VVAVNVKWSYPEWERRLREDRLTDPLPQECSFTNWGDTVVGDEKHLLETGQLRPDRAGWYIAFDNEGKPVPVGRGVAAGGWWLCPTAADSREVERLPEGWTLGPSFEELLKGIARSD
jgi:hypothetical protein